MLWPKARALTELSSAMIAQGNGDTDDEVLFLHPLYFASSDIASPKIIIPPHPHPPLSRDELLKNTTRINHFKTIILEMLMPELS